MAQMVMVILRRVLVMHAQLKKAQKVVSALPTALHSIRAAQGNATSVVEGAAAAAAAVTEPAAAAATPAKPRAHESEGSRESSGEMTADVEQLLAKIPSEFRRAICWALSPSLACSWLSGGVLTPRTLLTVLMIEAVCVG